MSSKKRTREADAEEPPTAVPAKNAIWPDPLELARLEIEKAKLERKEFYNLDAVRRRARRIALEAAHRSVTRSNPNCKTPAILRFSSTQSSDLESTGARGERHRRKKRQHHTNNDSEANPEPAPSQRRSKKEKKKEKKARTKAIFESPPHEISDSKIEHAKQHKARMDGEAAQTALRNLSTNAALGTVQNTEGDAPGPQAVKDKTTKSGRSLRRSRQRAERERALHEETMYVEH